MFTPIQFGKYFLTERIAVGGMAELFKAKLFGVSGFEKPMVVKQILPKYSKNEEFINMFIDEAKIAVTLLHGNIVPIYELGRIDGVYFIAMEYVHGKDLADLMDAARRKNKPVSPEHAAFLVIEICKGLEHAHRRTDAQGNPAPVIHRDISPPNVMVSMEGEVKITDFGIAKASHKLGSTEAGVVKGTFGYMSPEQVRGLPLDHRTDIFSAGILLHELLTGKRLFMGESEIEAIERVKETKVPAPSSIYRRIPSAIDPIVFKALAKDPTDRFKDANEFQLALSRFLFTAGTGATSPMLGQYMKELFPGDEQDKAEMAEEIIRQKDKSSSSEHKTKANRPPSNKVRRPSSSQGDRPRSQTARDVGAGAPVSIQATLAMPSISAGDLAPPPVLAPPTLDPEDSLPGSGLIHDDEKTSVFKVIRSPQRPEVPELHFPPKKERKPALADLGNQDTLDLNQKELGMPDLPESSYTDFTEDQLVDEYSTQKSPEIKETALGGRQDLTPTSSREVSVPDLMGLMTRAPSEEVHALDAEDAATAPGDSVATPLPSDRSSTPARRKKKVSGIVSSTMKLFVEGLDDEEAYPLEDDAEYEQIIPVDSSLTGSADKIPRTIKPTLVGWSLILIIVMSAGFFVLYKKTDLFGSGELEEDFGSLRPEDIAAEKAKPKKGMITLSSQPPGATFFLFLGETPFESRDRLDLGQENMLLFEREGYQKIYKTIGPGDYKEGKIEVHVSLAPTGPGVDLPLPDVGPMGEPSGKNGLVKVKSDPPMAMVWLIVGRGEVTLPSMDINRSSNFKAVLPGYRPGIAQVSAVDFKEGNTSFSTTVKLEKDPEVALDAGTLKSTSADAAPAIKQVVPVKPRVSDSPRPKRPTKTLHRKVKPKRAPSPPKVKPQSGPALKKPSWAQ